MRMILLGAGEGSRLKQYTGGGPKWLLKIRGIPLVDYLVGTAHECGMTEVVVVRGGFGGNARSPSVTYVEAVGAENMVDSLFRARRFLAGEIVVSYADILYQPSVLRQVMEAPGDIAVAIDTMWRNYYGARADNPLSIAESLVMAGDDIVEVGQALEGREPAGQYIGLIKLSARGAHVLNDVYDDLRRTHSGAPWRNAPRFEGAYMTDILQELIDRGVSVRAVPIEGGWLEFDTAQDYERVIRWDELGRLADFIALDQLPTLPSVVSAGGIAVRSEHGHWQALLVGDGSRAGWQIPKGMQEPEEAVEATAVREVAEETGTLVEIVGPLRQDNWTYEYDSVNWTEYCHLFLMRPTGREGAKRDLEHAVVAWMPIEEAVTRMRYPSEAIAMGGCLAMLQAGAV